MVLIEREHELAHLGTVVKEGASGRGGTIVIEGPPGIGKTALLDRTRRLADDVGMRVLTATAAELEGDIGFAVVRSLFEPVLASLPDDERGAVLDGAAHLARGPLGLRDGIEAAPVELGAAVHGIYWLCANLADREPLLLAIDDLHWADESSHLFLTYLARRVAEHPVVICATTRPSATEAAERYLNAICEQGEVLRPEPLTDTGIARVVGDVLSSQVEPEFSAACAQVSGGNPFLLVQMLASLDADGVQPIAAEAGRVGDVRTETLTRSLLARISRLGPEAHEVARSIAILGADAELRHIALLADLDPEAAARAISGLRREGILTPEAGHGFAHPLIRSAVYAGITEPDRGLAHLRAAKMLDEDGDDSRVASHLLVAAKNADGWVVDRLRTAAANALSIGVPSSAAEYLERALAEPAAESDRPELGLELGRALMRTGDLDAAAEALERAIDLVEDPVHRATIALELGRALRLAHKIPEAEAVLDQAVKRLPDGHHDEEMSLEIEIATAGHMGAASTAWVDRLGSVVDRAQGMSLPDRMLRSTYAWVAGWSGTRQAADVAQLARTCIDTSPGTVDPPFLLQSVATGLAVGGSFVEALDVLDQALETTEKLGDAVQFGFLCTTRTWIAYRAGRVLELEADARAVLAAPWDNPLYLNYAAAQLIVALIEQGALDEARNVLKERDLDETNEPDGLLGAMIYGFRGRLRRVCGRPREALADIERCRDIVLQAGFPGPPLSEWRLDAAMAHLALGERDLAREIADEDVALSRAFGAPRELGIALRSSGLVEDKAQGLDLLAESVDVLAGSEAVLDDAKSHVELGAALRRAGKRADAQDRLRKGLDLASRCGATAVAARARDELVAAGARPRREQLSGPDSLTASEMRVARLAAQGRSNAEIAQSLFVTRRTVEFHLTNAYRKLEIDSRDALLSALRPQQP